MLWIAENDAGKTAGMRSALGATSLLRPLSEWAVTGNRQGRPPGPTPWTAYVGSMSHFRTSV